MRIAKWVVIGLGGIAIALALAAVMITRVVDPNRYRGKVEAIVSKLAGRPFVIEGNLAIAWYPWLGVQTGAAHLGNPPGLAGPPILEWQSAHVAARLWPLIRGQVEVDHIVLQSPRLHLRRDKAGRSNWDGLGGIRPAARAGAPGSGGAGAAGSSGAGAAPAQASPSNPVEIAGIEVHDGTIDYVDELSGTQATLSKVELSAGAWRNGQPLPIRAHFVARTPALPPAGLEIGFDAPELAIRPGPLRVAAPRLKVTVASAHSEAHADGNMIYETTVDGHTRASGSVSLRTSSLRKLANDLTPDQTLPHDPTTLGSLELTTTWSYEDGSIAAKPLALELDAVSFKGWLQRTAPPRPMWDFELHGDRIDLSRYVEVDSRNKKPFELPVEALRAINANGSLIFDQVVWADTHMTDVRLKLQTPQGKP